MLTLTIDPKAYNDDPVRAWDELVRSKGVHKYLKSIGIDTYIVVVEVHPKRPDWFHLHILCDVPPGFRSYREDISEAIEQGWGRVTWSKDYGRDWQGAVHYLCGYVSKKADFSCPSWLMTHRWGGRQFRSVWASRNVGALVASVDRRGRLDPERVICDWVYDETEGRYLRWDGRVPIGLDDNMNDVYEPVPDFAADIAADLKKPPRRSPCRRVAECGQSASVVFSDDGKVHHVRKVRLGVGQLLLAMRDIAESDAGRSAGIVADVWMDEEKGCDVWTFDVPSSCEDWLMERLESLENKEDYFRRVRARMKLIKLGRRFSVSRASSA